MVTKRLFVKRKTGVSNPVPEACSLGIDTKMPDALVDDLPRIVKMVSEKIERGELDAANSSELVRLFSIVSAKCIAQCDLALSEAREAEACLAASSEYERALDMSLESAVERTPIE